MKSANLILIFGFTLRVAFGHLYDREHADSGIRGLEELATSPGPSILVGSSAQIHSTSSVPVVMSTAPTTAETASPALPLETTTSGSTQEASSPVPSSTLCANDTYFPRNLSIARYVGLSVAKQIPCMTNNSAAPCPYQNVTEWNSTFAKIKAKSPSVNAVRLYSAIDFVGEDAQVHLHEALSVIRSHNLKIVAGLWSGGPDRFARFLAELGALELALTRHGCDSIAAVSVGNEDLEDLNQLGETSDQKVRMVNTLVASMNLTRSLLRQHGCCDIPVTHADTWKELWDTRNPWVSQVSLVTMPGKPSLENLS